MVSLSSVQASNSLIATTLLPNLVAVFVGATSGIGEISLKKFAKYTVKPKAYFVGRSQEAGDRITAECKKLNPDGEYNFIKVDVSLIKNVDEVCDDIKKKEKTINILFLSAGAVHLDRSVTSENLHLLLALTFYSRVRFINNLTPLLQKATSLRRVVYVAGGGKEGVLDSSDFQALHVPFIGLRAHLTTMISLALEAVAKRTPEISFVHDFPGLVITPLFNTIKGLRGIYMRIFVFLTGYWLAVPLEECGERHLYFATSARYPAKKDEGGEGFVVELGEGVSVATGTNGEAGSGVYSVQWNGEESSPGVLKVLKGYREEGMVEQIWKHVEGEFERITGQ